MSAADPVNPLQGADDHGTAVIHHLSDHSAAHRRREEPATAYDDPSAEQLLTEHVEALFSKHGRTLSDDDTAQAYQITLDLVLMMMDGALVEGVVGEEQHKTLRGMLKGMKQAPGNL